MKTRLRILFAFFASGLVAGLAGCSGNECYENHSALPLATFYGFPSMQSVNLNRVEIYGIGAPGDSVLYSPQTLGQAYLPFRLWQDTTQYVFAYLGEIPDSIAAVHPELVPRDTVTFIYRPKEWFVSPACGAMYFYDMDTVCHTRFLIDSISYNKVITNENVTNIQMFFRDGNAE